MITRRKFLASSAAFGGALLVATPDLPFFLRKGPGALAAPFSRTDQGDTLITILHTNDTHSQIDPVPANGKLYAGRVWRAGLPW